MAVHLRTRLLLVAAVTVLGVATWLNVDAQRARMADRQGQIVSAADLRTAMVDQETGVRGFDQTGSEEFLEPFERGRRDYLRTLAAARRDADDPEVARQLAEMAEVAARWQALAGAAVEQIRSEGPGSLSVQGARERKAVMDHFRTESALFRSLPGSAAVVLRRDASNRQLLPVTDADAIAGLGDRLQGAAPRDCLAVRRGAAYERRASQQPLQPCTICGDIPGASRCTPSLVGGEVIGSLLVTRHSPIEPDAATCLSSAVNQAAPVLANLRNLAIAEHRAATDGLTGLPNAPATRRSRPSAPSCAAVSAPATSRAAGAGRSSSSCCPTRTPPARRRWPRSCARRSPRRRCRASRRASRPASAPPRSRRMRTTPTACCARRTGRSTRPSRAAATASSSPRGATRRLPDAAGPMLDWARSLVVGVAQLVELRVVVPAAAGSSPVAHPSEAPATRAFRVSGG